jgi:hypothetical protein
VRALVFGAVGAAALAFRRPNGWGALLAFSAATALPITALHLVYFYGDERFYVYPLSLCAVIGAAGVASLLPASWRRQPWLALALLAAAFVALPPLGDRMDWFLPDGQPPRRATADLVHRTTPDDAVVISDVEPVYLAAVAPATWRRRATSSSLRRCWCASASTASSLRRAGRSTTRRPACSRTVEHARFPRRPTRCTSRSTRGSAPAGRCSSRRCTRPTKPRSRACSARRCASQTSAPA